MNKSQYIAFVAMKTIVKFDQINVDMHCLCIANILLRFNQDNIKKVLTSDGSFFRVTFRSNHVYDATGFEAFYQFRQIEGIVHENMD